MKDFYFITGLGLGALVGMAVMYKSKKAKEIAKKCEESITETTNDVKEKLQLQKKQKGLKPKAKNKEQ